MDAEPEAEEKADLKAVKKTEKKPKAKEYTLAEVRMVLSDKSRQRYTSEVKKLLQKYGADKLSGVAPAKYADLMACQIYRVRYGNAGLTCSKAVSGRWMADR